MELRASGSALATLLAPPSPWRRALTPTIEPLRARGPLHAASQVPALRQSLRVSKATRPRLAQAPKAAEPG